MDKGMILNKQTTTSLATFASASAFLALAACGGGGGGSVTTGGGGPGPTVTHPRPPVTTSSPEYHLETARFTTHQPDVLEQIGAHHAYARGLTGRGVRIGIDDSIVDYTQRGEFGSRVRLRDSDGADLSYSHPFGDEPFSDVNTCQQDPTCQIWEGDSQGDDEALNNWVRDIVNQDGWPIRDDTVFVVDEYYPQDGSIGQLYRWWEIPTPYGEGAHGTVVASVAAGKNLGVAPEATIIPIARNLTDDQDATSVANRVLQLWIAALSNVDRRQLDDLVARDVRANYAKFDIINRSYGRSLSQLAIIDSIESARWFHTYLPETQNAIWQTDRPDADKTIVVYAAGNDGDPAPGLGALLPYGFQELRGHSLAVVATDPQTGVIAGYSNLCGPLPSDWDPTRHGPHYCLAAPGTGRGLVPNPNSPGRGDIGSGLYGTSFAAPVVSGALALLMEHFRGTRGNTAIVKRMLDTADRSGRYADLETYGAGHLDLEAALTPVGTLNAGQSAQSLGHTTLQVPAAFGSVAERVDGLELATFDEQDFPFWVPVSALLSTPEAGGPPIPEIEGPQQSESSALGPNALGLHWMPDAESGSLWLSDKQEWVAGLGPTSVNLTRLPKNDGWGYGLSLNGSEYLGARTSGAFGAELSSGMVWASRTTEHELGGGWKLDATGTLAISRPHYEKRAIFQASPSVFSALAMRIGTDNTGLTVEQPLRAESGVGTFRVENGMMENGRRLYDEYRIRLRPDAREVRMTLRHERRAVGGRIALEVGGAMNAGHVPGEHDTRIGFAYRMDW